MKKKKSLLLINILMFIMLMCVFSSCSKDDDGTKFTVKNLTGIDWYDASIIFKESSDASSKIINMVKVGDVPVGQSFTTDKVGTFFYINAKNRRGKLFMSEIVYGYENTSITSNEILVNL